MQTCHTWTTTGPRVFHAVLESRLGAKFGRTGNKSELAACTPQPSMGSPHMIGPEEYRDEVSSEPVKVWSLHNGLRSSDRDFPVALRGDGSPIRPAGSYHQWMSHPLFH